MSTDVEDTPLFAQVAGEDAERVLALITDRPPPPSSEELLAMHRRAS